MQLIYAETKIKIDNASEAEIYDRSKYCWKELKIEFEKTTKGTPLDATVFVIAKDDLTSHKHTLNRAVDQQDIAAICSDQHSPIQERALLFTANHNQPPNRPNHFKSFQIISNQVTTRYWYNLNR